MKLTDILFPLLLNYWYIWLLLLLIKIWRLPSVKGWFGEKLVEWALKRLPATDYHVFHDLYFPRPDGKGTTQVDHLVVSRFGLFVIETKNYQGWIFGSEKQRTWTQSIYKKKFKFQSPLHQNKLHINALAAFLDLPKSDFHNIIYFIGECTLKTKLPPNVMTSGMLKWIKSHKKTLLSDKRLQQILTDIESHTTSYNKREVAKQHKVSLRSNVEC
jgi:hypothetical protein